MANEWYVTACGEEFGPLSDQQLREMVAKEQLTPLDRIRKASSTNWVPAARVRGLFTEGAPVSSTSSVRSSAAVSAATPRQESAPPTETSARSAGHHLIECPDCRKRISPHANACPNCGHAFFRPSRSLAIALAWTLGGIGVHKFYLRRPGEGLIALLLCVTFLPAIVALIEGFQWLGMDDDAFAQQFGSLRPRERREARPLKLSKVILCIVGIFTLPLFIALAAAAPLVALAMLAVGLSLLPQSRRYINSRPILQRFGLSTGTLWLWTLSLVCAGEAIFLLARSASVAQALVLFGSAVCLTPFFWQKLGICFPFVSHHEVQFRSIAAIIAIAVALIVNNQPQHSARVISSDWYSEGTLLDDSPLYWQNATPENKAASCGQLLAAYWSNQGLNDDLQNSKHSLDELRPLANELVSLVDAATKKNPDEELNRRLYINQTIREIAIKGLTSKGYLKVTEKSPPMPQPASDPADATREIIGSW